MIIIETLLQNEKVFVSSKYAVLEPSKNNKQVIYLSKEFRKLRHLEEENATKNNQTNTNNDLNKLNQTAETITNKTLDNVNSQGFLKEEIKNSTQIAYNNKTSEIKENNAATTKSPKDETNKAIESNKTEAAISTNSTSNENKHKDSEEEEKGESLKVDLKDSNKTQSKGSNKDLKDGIENKKDEIKKSISEPEKETYKEKTEIDSLSELYNDTKKSNDAVKIQEEKEDDKAINTSKNSKDSTPITENEDKKADLTNADNDGSNKSYEEYFILILKNIFRIIYLNKQIIF